MSAAEGTTAPVSYLEMSDEELSKVDIGSIGVSPPAADEGAEADPVADESADDAGTTDDAQNQDPEAGSEATADEDNEDTKTDEPAKVVEGAEAAPAKSAPAAKDPVDSSAKTVEPATVADAPAVVIDYKAEYDRFMAPFKANGKEIAVNSIDDAISLMQMGANYNKKMAGLKPNLKLMKLLENNGLLSEERIGFLIDLEKKDPAAINKLIKDSGLDPMDLDAGKAGDYTPKAYKVDDKEMELDTVLDSIQDSPSYNRTLDIVSTKWDGASKQTIAATPQLLKVINEHIESGIYDTIAKEVERERVFGRLAGLSDIEAYRQVGDAIQARGGFATLGHQAQKPAPVVVQPKPKVLDETLKDKKRAAGGNKLAAPSQPNKEFNPLGLSDAEFEKMAQSRFA